MTDDQFRSLCSTFGFAPSRALRELIDCVRAQEIEACARVCEAYIAPGIGQEMAVAIRARKEKQ